MYKFKIGDKVKLTTERFLAFGGKQGVIDPLRIYTVTSINDNIRLKEIENQGHGKEQLVLYKKPIVIITK